MRSHAEQWQPVCTARATGSSAGGGCRKGVQGSHLLADLLVVAQHVQPKLRDARRHPLPIAPLLLKNASICEWRPQQSRLGVHDARAGLDGMIAAGPLRTAPASHRCPSPLLPPPPWAAAPPCCPSRSPRAPRTGALQRRLPLRFTHCPRAVLAVMASPGRRHRGLSGFPRHNARQVADVAYSASGVS